MIKKIAYAFLIVLFIQLLNQFMLLSGSALERTWLSGYPNARIMVGAYQQILQAVTGITLYYWHFKKDPSALGINTKNKALSLQLFAFYALAWCSIITLFSVSAYYFFPGIWASLTAVELPQASTMIATLLFQSFFPGFGEEILFRGFIVSLLSTYLFTNFNNNAASKLGIILLSSFYFATAHIYFTVKPFHITHIDYLQLLTAFGCGLFYAITYLKTKSLLTPFLAHNFSNTSATICGYIISRL